MKNDIRKFLAAAGKKGGEETKKKHGPNFYKELGKKGSKARWSKTIDKELATPEQ